MKCIHKIYPQESDTGTVYIIVNHVGHVKQNVLYIISSYVEKGDVLVKEAMQMRENRKRESGWKAERNISVAQTRYLLSN